jgi:uncharacterized protein YbaR (Trm112 family)
LEESLIHWGIFKSNEVLAGNDSMKKDLMEIICCPTCKGDLALSIEKEDEKEIITGTLTCGKCSVEYLIEDGIPNLLPKNIK